MYLIIAGATLVVLITWLFLRSGKKSDQSYWEQRNVPYCDTSNLVSGWDRLRSKRGVHEFENKVYNKARNEGFTTYVGTSEFNIPFIYVLDPDIIKSVLVKDFDCFVDRRKFNLDKTDPNFSKILHNTNGKVWKGLRATMSPTFTSGRLRKMYPAFTESSNKLGTYIQQQIQKKGNELEFSDIMTRYTMDVIAVAAFAIDPQSFSDVDSEITKCAKGFQGRYSGILALKFVLTLYFPKVFKFLGIAVTHQDSLKFFTKVIQEAIQHREKTGERQEDFLQLLMDTRNPSENSTEPEEPKDTEGVIAHPKVYLTDDVILANAILFFFGGFSGLEVLMRMAAYEMSVNPDMQEKLYQEIHAASEGNGGILSYDVVMGLTYLDQVVQETLRKWPPSLRLERSSTKPYTYPNPEVTVEKGILTIIPVYGLHHDERYFPNPSKFDPERFSPENKAKRHPYTFLPFGAGPRICIASRFAVAEAKAGIAHLILKFKLEPSPKTKFPMEFKANTAFKPKKGMYLRVTCR